MERVLSQEALLVGPEARGVQPFASCATTKPSISRGRWNLPGRGRGGICRGNRFRRSGWFAQRQGLIQAFAVLIRGSFLSFSGSNLGQTGEVMDSSPWPP